MRNPKQLFTNLLVLCVSLIAITGILELALRIYTPSDIKAFRQPLVHSTGKRCEPLFVYDRVRGSRLAVNCTTTSIEARNREYSITIHSNNHGFRDYKDYRFDKRDGTVRVVVIGDSFSYGNGVEELGRYSNLLDDLLGEHVEVYNLAISSYGLDQALLTLQTEGLRYDPDVILVGFSDPMLSRLSRNATSSLWSKPFFELEQGDLRLRQQPNENTLAVESFLDNSYLWMFAVQRISAILSKLGSRDDGANNAALTEKIIERLLEIVRGSKSSLVIFTINRRNILKQNLDSAPDLNRFLGTLPESSDFHFLDLYPVFKSFDSASLFYPIDGHYNVKGHILVAQELCKFFQARAILAAKGTASCEVDEAALYKSIETFRRCSFSNTNMGWFPGGKCFPRE